jgi:RecA/RadA recombinase
MAAAPKKEPAVKSFGFKKSAKDSGNTMLSKVVETAEYISATSYTLNAVLSGTIYGGIPSNQITMLAGENSTGKTYIMMRLAYNAYKQGYRIYYFDSEGAVEDAMFENYNIPEDCYQIMPVNTVEQFRKQCSHIVDDYAEYVKSLSAKEYASRDKIIIMLDSLGNLASEKELEDTRKDKDTRAMSKQQMMKRFFTELTVRLNVLQIPLVLTNHVYEVIGAYVPSKEISGGSGGKYNASNTMMFSKTDMKDKKTNEYFASLMTVQVKKSRRCRPRIKVNFVLHYDGLGDIAEKAGLIKKTKVGSSNAFIIQDPKLPKDQWPTVLAGRIDTKEGVGTIMAEIDEWVRENFKLKNQIDADEDDAVIDDESSEEEDSDEVED